MKCGCPGEASPAESTRRPPSYSFAGAAALSGFALAGASVASATRAWVVVALIALIALLAAGPAPNAAAQPAEPWLDEFPSTEKVLGAIKSRDKNDTAARQFAALVYLRDAALFVGGAAEEFGAQPTRPLTPREQAIYDSFTTRAAALRAATVAAIDGGIQAPVLPSEAAFTGPAKRFYESSQFRSAVLRLLMSPAWRNAYVPVMAAREKDRQQRERERVAAERKAAQERAAAERQAAQAAQRARQTAAPAQPPASAATAQPQRTTPAAAQAPAAAPGTQPQRAASTSAQAPRPASRPNAATPTARAPVPAPPSPTASLLSFSLRQPIALGIYLLGVFGVLRSWRPVRLGDPDLFELTGTSKRLDAITGPVYGVGMHSVVTTEVTSTTTHDRYGAQTSRDVSTKTDVHRQFFIAPPDGAHVPMEFVNWNPHLTEGQLVSCVWWRGKRERTVETGSRVLMVFNHTTGIRYSNDKNIDAVVKPSLWPALCFAGPIVFLAFAAGLNDDDLWGPGLAAAGIFIGYWIVRGIGNLFRARRFWNRDCERISDHLRATVKQDQRIVLGPGTSIAPA
jgi:hypothetical protein